MAPAMNEGLLCLNCTHRKNEHCYSCGACPGQGQGPQGNAIEGPLCGYWEPWSGQDDEPFCRHGSCYKILYSRCPCDCWTCIPTP